MGRNTRKVQRSGKLTGKMRGSPAPRAASNSPGKPSPAIRNLPYETTFIHNISFHNMPSFAAAASASNCDERPDACRSDLTASSYRIRIAAQQSECLECFCRQLLCQLCCGKLRLRRAAWPDHSAVKSPDPAISDFDRSGARVAAASGNSGTTSDIGPTSRMRRFTIPRAGRPVNTFVTTVSLSFVFFSA